MSEKLPAPVTESIRLVLNTYEGCNIVEPRTWYTADGKLKPGKGFAAEVRHLPHLAAEMAKPAAKARELRLIDDGEAANE
jgi:hypothetical protein